MPFLKVFTHGEERTVFLGDEPIVFGRGDDVGVLLKDVKVSREHCVIEKDESGQWRVRDLRSGNGTRVNGAAIQAHVLEPEDVVEVGDAKVLFAAEAAAVVVDRPAAPPPQRPARARVTRPSKSPYIIGGIAVVGLVALGLLWGGKRDKPEPDRESATGSRPPAIKTQEPARKTADDIERTLPEGLDAYARLAQLEAMLPDAPADDRAAVSAAIQRARDAVERERERFFGDIEAVFRKQVSEGQFARAREIWFFLRGDEHWSPIPPVYRDRIIRAMTEMEHGASAARSRVLDEVTRAEEARDFDHAEKLVKQALPRFAGTSVERSLQERLQEIDRARRGPVRGGPSKAKTRVRADVRKRMTELLAQMKTRDFAAVAKQMEALVSQAGAAEARTELERRAKEVSAAADLQARLAARLAAGNAPRKQIAKRWRVLKGDAQGVTVRSKGAELTWPWAEVPAQLHLELLALEGAGLGLAVAAHAIGGDAEQVTAFALVYADNQPHADVDRYLSEVVRNEPMPEGGYVVHAGQVMAKGEFIRQQEEELIERYRAQLDKAFTAIRSDRAVKKLDKLAAKKDELDKRRAHALELIFDAKKYFYPYRNRSNEYYPVQKEVDHRVDAVREVWDDPAQTRVGLSDAMKRHLKSFDEAAGELTKRFVDVEEKLAEVTFLRSYFGKSFNVHTLYRTPEERDLLEYGVEVMAWNTTVKGDITDIEREQVRVTNVDRLMFGRWPVRIVEKLVASSRGHCEEMSRLGYFGHFSTTPGRRTPYDRMRLAGYQYGASENCVMGTSDPKSAHERWCHSSGHHRNLLTAAWTEMGTGHYGSLIDDDGEDPYDYESED
ncbi:MAG: FHA domain-containing protein [Planctomycetota bacterium]|jgi:uncharacterized protein YkwD